MKRTALLSCSLAILLGGAVLANAEPISSTGLQCDTVEQVKRFIEVAETSPDPRLTLLVVNKEFDTPEATTWACAISTVAYNVVGKMDEVDTEEGLIEIYEVQIIGFVKNGQWYATIPVNQFIPVRVPEGVVRGTSI